MWVDVLTAAQAAIPKMDPGWTWTATIQLISLIIGAPIGGGLLWTTAKGVALLWQKSNESKKQDTDAAAAVRKEMMDLADRQNKRIDTLETALRDERKRCDDETDALRKEHVKEMADLRRIHADEIKAMHERMEGLHKQFVTMQRTTGRAIQAGLNAPTTTSRMPDDIAGIGDVLKQAFDIPGTEDEI